MMLGVGHRVFVVGGTGLLGRAVATHLLVAGWRVRLLVRIAVRAQQLLGSGFDYPAETTRVLGMPTTTVRGWCLAAKGEAA